MLSQLVLGMDANQLLSLLGCQADDPVIEAAFVALRTLRRPELDSQDRDSVRDWVLIRRQGIEFGFVDDAFFNASEKYRRRRKGVSLILYQIYFFTRRDDIDGYTGNLPFGLDWLDNRDEVRRKLLRYEPTRRSYLKDTWDVPGYRMTVAYNKKNSAIDNIVCQLRLRSWSEEGRLQPALGVNDWVSLFGLSVTSDELCQRLQPLNLEERIEQDGDEREVDFSFECGLELYFTEAKQLKQITDAKQLKQIKKIALVKRKALVLGAVQFFRSRELDARQWDGELPFGLSFDDTQQTMLNKIECSPDEQEDDLFSGVALWHFTEFSLEIMYNNVENHLQRLTLMAPGFWTEN